jgi:DNA-binding response OmpR family regulator
MNSTNPSKSSVFIEGLANKRVLVVDDDEFVCELVAKVLTRYLGMEVYKASDGSEGIAAALTGRYDCALIDLVLPKTSGQKVIRTIRTMQPNFPIIVMTGQGMEEVVRSVRRLGISRVLQKPFKLVTLIEEVTNILSGGKALPVEK